jgi:hypothetical protein
VLIVAVVGTYFELDWIMTRVTQSRLDKLEGVKGTFDHLHVTVFPPGYDIYDLSIRELPLHKSEEPIARAHRIEMKWSWKELLKLRLVRKIKIWDAKVVIHLKNEPSGKEKLAKQAKDYLPPPKNSREWLERQQAFRLERFEIIDSQVLIVDEKTKGHPRVWFHDVQAALENLASRRPLTYGKPALVSARGLLQHTGKLDLFVSADPLDEKLSFAGQARLRDLQLEDLYEYVAMKTGLQIPTGTFDVFAEFICKQGKLTGGIKPVLKNAKVRAAQPGLGAKIKAALADVAVKILSDRVPGRNAVATIIPIHGDINHPDVQMWPTVLAVVRNAFVEGLSASLSNLPPPQAQKKEGLITQARRTLSKGKHPPVKAQPQEGKK